MKKLMSVVLGLSLLIPVATFAQDTGGDKAKLSGKKAAVKTESKVEKGHKGGKKGKKGTKGTASSNSTTPPPK